MLLSPKDTDRGVRHSATGPNREHVVASSAVYTSTGFLCVHTYYSHRCGLRSSIEGQNAPGFSKVLHKLRMRNLNTGSQGLRVPKSKCLGITIHCDICTEYSVCMYLCAYILLFETQGLKHPRGAHLTATVSTPYIAVQKSVRQRDYTTGHVNLWSKCYSPVPTTSINNLGSKLGAEAYGQQQSVSVISDSVNSISFGDAYHRPTYLASLGPCLQDAISECESVDYACIS